MPLLVLLVSSLPADALPGLPHLSRWPRQARLRPGLGYGRNHRAELLAGQRPDAAGFLATSAPVDRAAQRPGLLLRALRALGGADGPVLPPAQRGLFREVGAEVLAADWPGPSIFRSHPELRRAEGTGRIGPARDEASLEAALAAAAAGEKAVFARLGALAALAPRVPGVHEAWAAQLAWLDLRVEAAAERFLAAHPGGRILLLSEQGGADVHGRVELDLEAALGPPGPGRYLYFTDATLLRAWVEDPRLGEELAALIEASPVARPVLHEERRRLGCVDPRFGDFLALLDEGLCFARPMHDGRLPARTAGYDPDAPSQAGLWLQRGGTPDETTSPSSLLEAHAALRALLAEALPGGEDG